MVIYILFGFQNGKQAKAMDILPVVALDLIRLGLMKSKET